MRNGRKLNNKRPARGDEDEPTGAALRLRKPLNQSLSVYKFSLHDQRWIELAIDSIETVLGCDFIHPERAFPGQRR